MLLADIVCWWHQEGSALPHARLTEGTLVLVISASSATQRSCQACLQSYQCALTLLVCCDPAGDEDTEPNHVHGTRGLPQQRSRVRLSRAGSLELGELPTSTTGTASGSDKPSQSPGVSEAGGEEAGMQELDHLNAG